MVALLTQNIIKSKKGECKPFRNRKEISNNKIAIFSATSIFLFFTVGILGTLYDGFDARFNNSFIATIKPSPKRKACHTSGKNYITPEKACRYGGEKITWASFGDSHTVEPAFALSKLLEPKSEGLVHLSFSGCAPALSFNVKVPGCSEWIKESLNFLEQNNEIENVLLGFRYSAFLFGDQLSSYPNTPDESPVNHMTNMGKIKKNSAREKYWSSLYEIIIRLRNSGKNIYIFYPIPELPLHILNATTPFFTVIVGCHQTEILLK